MGMGTEFLGNLFRQIPFVRLLCHGLLCLLYVKGRKGGMFRNAAVSPVVLQRPRAGWTSLEVICVYSDKLQNPPVNRYVT